MLDGSYLVLFSNNRSSEEHKNVFLILLFLHCTNEQIQYINFIIVELKQRKRLIQLISVALYIQFHDDEIQEILNYK